MSKLKTKNKYEGCPEELVKKLKAGESIKGGYSIQDSKYKCFLIDYNSAADRPYNVYDTEDDCYFWCKDFIPEYEEEFDWGKVPVDTLVEVSDDGVIWYKRYFIKHNPKTDYPYVVFYGGCTSKTTENEGYYKFCRIVENK